MRLRLLIAAVLLAVLGGAVYWSNKKAATDEAKPAADASPKVLSVPEDQIKQLELKKAGVPSVVLSRGGDGKWQITAPEPLRVDQDAVSSLVSTVSSLASDRLVEEKTADFSSFGLDKPGLEVTVTKKDGKTEKVLIGDETPTGSGFFARISGDPRVFSIASFNKTSLDKTAKDLRDKRLLTFDSDKLSRVELNAKSQSIEFGKNNQNEWQIVKPKPLRADGWAVEELVRKLKDAKMDTSVSDEDAKKAAASFASGTRIATAKVTDVTAAQEIEVRKDKDNYYAKSSAIAGVHKVANDLGEGLNKGVDDFRNKKLFDFAFNDPNKIEVHDGAKTRVFQKSGEKWTSDGKQMDSTSVQALVDKLRDLSATKFVEQGFAAPVIELTVTSNDGKRVEKVLISKSGNAYVAKRDNEAALYELDTKAVEDLQRAAADVKEPPPAPKK
jgi:hypothetical protein